MLSLGVGTEFTFDYLFRRARKRAPDKFFYKWRRHGTVDACVEGVRLD